MSACTNCVPFDADVVVDYATGDRICVECGLVLENDFTLSESVATYNAQDAGLMHAPQRAVRRLMVEYDLASTVCETVCAWMEHSTRSLKVVTCAMHFCEQEKFTYTNVRKLCARMHVHFDDVCSEIQAIQNHTRHVNPKEDTVYATWVSALQAKLVEVCSQIVCTREEVAHMKTECGRLIENHPDCLFHNIESIAWAIVLERGFSIEHLLAKSAKSQIRMIRKKLF